MRVSITEQLQTYSIEILSQYRVHIEQETIIHKYVLLFFSSHFKLFFGFYTKI